MPGREAVGGLPERSSQPPPAHHPGRPGSGRPSPGRPGGPGARPSGPRVRPPTPAAHHTPAVVEPIVESVDPHLWGRIDDDGVVYVRTAAGERAIGNWQAGDTEAGLQHFGRKFDDFSTEIALLEARLASGTGDPKATKAQAIALREQVETLPADRRSGHRRDPAGDRHRRRRRGHRRCLARPDRRPGGRRQGQGGALRRGRGTGRVDPVEDHRRPAEGDRRGMADHPRHRPEDRRRAVEAVRQGPGHLHPAPRLALRRTGQAARRRQGRQGGADREGGGAVRRHRLGRDRRRLPDPDGRMEGRRPGAPGRRGRAVGAVPGRPGEVLLPPQQDVLRPGRRVRGQRRDQGEAARRGREDRPGSGSGRRPRPRCGRSRNAGRRPARCRGSGSASSTAGCKAVEDKLKSAEDRHWRRTDPETDGAGRAVPGPGRVLPGAGRQGRGRPATSARPSEAETQAAQWEEWLKTAQSAVDG